MKVNYNYLDCLFLKDYVDDFKNVLTLQPMITFENYICSQLHYDVLVNKNNRDIKAYNSAYNFLCGRSSNIRSYKKVLKYYYLDLSNLIFSSPSESSFGENDFSILGNSVIPRSEELKVLHIDIDNLISDIIDYLHGNISIVSNDIDIERLLKNLNIKFFKFEHKRLLTEGLLMLYVLDSDYDCIGWR